MGLIFCFEMCWFADTNATQQISTTKLPGFFQNFKEAHGYYEFSQTNTIQTNNLLSFDISRNQSMNFQNGWSGGVLKKRCNIGQNK